MKFSELSGVFSKVEGIQSRNEMTEILSEFYKKLNKDEIQIVSYLIGGRVVPMFVKAEFNYSDKSLINLLSSVCKVEGIDFDVEGSFREIGDIGDLVFAFLEKKGSQSKGKSIEDIYDSLWDMVNVQGEGAVERKNSMVSELLFNMDPLEGKYISRIICGSLRLGVNSKTLLDVFSYAVVGDKSIRELLDRAYGVSADIGYIASKCVGLKESEATKSLGKFKVKPGIPVLARLVERVGSFEEVFERMGSPVLVQPKFDGLRCQIHKFSKKEQFKNLDVVWRGRLDDGGEESSLFGLVEDDVRVVLFTRNLEDVTEMFPEIVDTARRINIESFVLDSEILGWNYEKDTFLSYQETMQRRRKYSVGKKMEDVPVQAMIFDVLYQEGEDLTQIDTSERVKMLNKEYRDTPEGIRLSETEVVEDEQALEEAFDKYVSKGLEGIIVKQEKGGYKAGFRNYEWIKMKKSMNKGLVDTIDMVVVGYFKGKGRRADFGLGALLGAVLNEKDDTLDVVCKVGTGLSDDMLKSLSKELEKSSVKEKDSKVRFGDILTPDVWVKPLTVITVEADEITRNLNKSEESFAGGLSLRFPRLIDLREDKGVGDITTVEELLKMYNIQNS